MGNPHAVAFIDAVSEFDLGSIGPHVERHPVFPNRVNFHVARVNSRSDVTMRTWERGAGMTQACGTGACAVLVAGVLEGLIDRTATLHLPGGDLRIEWSGETDTGPVYMTGPATEVFSGQWDESTTP
jgi:diaminopimelate epimerase